MESTSFIGKANELKTQGEAKLKGSFFKNFMSSKSDRQQEAIELFTQAANCYKLANDSDNAFQMYVKCAELEKDEGFKAQHLKDAAMVAKNSDSLDKYAAVAQQAIQLFAMAGRISSACSLCKDVAEKLDEDYNYEKARQFYERAYELYMMDNTGTYANQCLSRSCDLTILGKDYGKLPNCIKNYEKIGLKYLSQTLVKSSAKDYFFKIVLCYLANEDMPGAERALEKYTIEDPSFDDSRPQKFLISIVQAIKDSEQQKFANYVAQYNQITPFDKVNTELIVKIKSNYMPSEYNDALQASKFDLVNGDDDKQNEPKRPVTGKVIDSDEDDGDNQPSQGFDLT